MICGSGKRARKAGRAWNSVGRARGVRYPDTATRSAASVAITHASARARPGSVQRVALIADEDKRRGPCQLCPVDVGKPLHKRIAPHARGRRPDGRGPFAAAEPVLLQVTCFHQLRVNAEAGIVEEE